MMRKFCSVILVLFSLCLSLPAVGRAESTELQRLLAELKVAAAATETLSSRFVQEKHLSFFSEKLLSQGLFVYQAPDRLRWELLAPIASGFVLRGDEGERWNGLSREREKFSVENDPIMGLIAKQLLAWARVDLDWLQKRYKMTVVNSQPISLRLTPLDAGEAGFIDYLQVRFAGNRRYIDEVLMMEQGGDSTLLRFTDVQLNKALQSNPFQPLEFQ
jgi:outer membrane lipoprotein-sorting protein